MYLWRVLVSGIDSREDYLRGTNPRMEVLLKHGVLDPLHEDVLYSHLKDLYVLGTSS